MTRHKCETKFWPVGYVTATTVSRGGSLQGSLSPDWDGNILAARSQNRDDLGKEDAQGSEMGLKEAGSLMPAGIPNASCGPSTSGLLPGAKLNFWLV